MTGTVRVLLIAADPGSRALVVDAIDELPDVWLTVAFSPGEARILLNAYRYHSRRTSGSVRGSRST